MGMITGIMRRFCISSKSGFHSGRAMKEDLRDKFLNSAKSHLKCVNRSYYLLQNRNMAEHPFPKFKIRASREGRPCTAAGLRGFPL